jgi:hypothetical protein
MNRPRLTFSFLLFALSGTFSTLGCGQPSSTPTSVPSATSAEHDHATHTASSEKGETVHDHSGWWCVEHGIPEAVCSMCNSKVAAEFQKKGDWCQQHDRADSQCFVCHPELEAKFAAQYEAKYGEQPPKPAG